MPFYRPVPGSKKARFVFNSVYTATPATVGCHSMIMSGLNIQHYGTMRLNNLIEGGGTNEFPVSGYGTYVDSIKLSDAAQNIANTDPTLPDEHFAETVKKLDEYKDLIVFSGPVNYGVKGMRPRDSKERFGVARFAEYLRKNKIGSLTASPILTNRNHLSTKDTMSMNRGYMWIPPSAASRSIQGTFWTSGGKKNLLPFDDWKTHIKKQYGIDLKTLELEDLHGS